VIKKSGIKNIHENKLLAAGMLPSSLHGRIHSVFIFMGILGFRFLSIMYSWTKNIPISV